MDNMNSNNNHLKSKIKKNKYIDKVYNLYKKDFTKLSALFIVTITIIMWILKLGWYFFKLGQFSLFNIDSSYIGATSDSVLFQIAQTAVIAGVYLFSNSIFYYIINKKAINKKELVNKLKDLLFLFIVQLVVCFTIIAILAGYNIINAYLELFIYAKTSWIKILITSFSILYMLNCFGFILWWNKRKDVQIKEQQEEEKKEKVRKRKKKSKKNKEKEKWKDPKFLKRLLKAIVFAVSVELGFTYFWGLFYAHNRVSYKVVYETVENKKDSNDKYIFQYDNKLARKNIFIVAYENKDVYILLPLYKEDNEVKIDFSKQKIIDKINVLTDFSDNIYDLK